MRLILLLLLLASPLRAQELAPAAPPFTPALAAETLQAVRAAAAEGLDPADYGEARLAAGIPRAHLEALLPTHPDYAALRAALATAPAADRPLIRANLDRWRWFPRQPGERYILVNIPAFELVLVDGGRPIATHRVIVGKPATPTLAFSTVATGVILNPEWVVPRSIIAESVGALIARSPATARARGYRWTGSGPTLSVVQAPGPGNSLGQVKLDMPNPHSIFIHDTPAKALFDRPSRAFSHGCIRTDRAIDLAATLLADMRDQSRAAIDAALASGSTQRIALARQVPVHVIYVTAVPAANGSVRRLPDLYGRDPAVIAALTAGAPPRASERTAEPGCYAEMPNRPA